MATSYFPSSVQRGPLNLKCHRRIVTASVCMPALSKPALSSTPVTSSHLERERREAAQHLRDCSKKLSKLSKKVRISGQVDMAPTVVPDMLTPQVSADDHSTRVSDIPLVKVAKAKLHESMALLGEFAMATEVLNRRRYELEDVLCRMSAAGYVEECSSSSSSSGDCGTDKPVAVPASEGLASVVAAKEGSVLVCEGKACQRKGYSDEIHASLGEHFSRSGSKVVLDRCTCLGTCKTASNIQVFTAADRSWIVTGVTLEGVQQALQRSDFAASVA
jgi:hypothetical protein